MNVYVYLTVSMIDAFFNTPCTFSIPSFDKDATFIIFKLWSLLTFIYDCWFLNIIKYAPISEQISSWTTPCSLVGSNIYVLYSHTCIFPVYASKKCYVALAFLCDKLVFARWTMRKNQSCGGDIGITSLLELCSIWNAY